MRIKKIDHVQSAMPHGKKAEARVFYEGALDIPEIQSRKIRQSAAAVDLFETR